MAMLMLGLYVALLLGGQALRWLNQKHLRANRHEIPSGFEEAIDGDRLARHAAYAVAHARVGVVADLASGLVGVGFLFGGGLALYDRVVAASGATVVGRGVLFFLGLLIAARVLSVPASLYTTFIVERNFGFSTTTPRLWLVDWLKGSAISLLLGGAVVAAGMALVVAWPRWWWCAAWFGLALLVVLLQLLVPTVIAPLFNRYTPIEDDALAGRIRHLARSAGVAVDRVLQVDASRRSRHSNAYFTGIGRVKRVVLFDTLLAQLSPEEALAVVAHELGHWRGRHVLQRLLLSLGVAGVVLWGAATLVERDWIPGLVGLEEGSFYARMLVLAFAGSLLSSLTAPMAAAWSRHHERQADRYAVQLLADPAPLAAALVKLATENLANLHPHPLYARLFYSHPPVVERVAWLRSGISSA